MNYGYDSLNCFTLVLCGESHLNNILSKPVRETLKQRITVHYNYSGLKDSKVATYILHKIEYAGTSRAIIEKVTLSAIHSYTQKNPRLIDNFMTYAIAFGSQLGKHTLEAEVILHGR